MAKKDGETTSMVPKLRFPEFREGPEWVESPLGDVVSPIVRERDKPATSYTGLGIRSHGKGTFLKPFEQPEKNSMDRLFEVDRHDLIVNITFAWEGAIAIVGPDDAGALVSHRFPTYTFDQNKALPEFFRYPILGKQFIYKLGIISPGGAGRNRVMSKGDFLKLKLPIPSVAEQRKIAACLTSLDALIAARERKLAALAAHKKGLMQQLFPRPGEPLPRLRFPEFHNAGEWETKPLSAYVSALDAGVSVLAGDRPANGDEVGVLKTSCVTAGSFDPSENKVVSDTAQIARVQEPVQANTIIISRMNTVALVGANAYVDRDIDNLFLPDRLWAVKGNAHANMRFIAYVIGSDRGRAALSAAARGSSGSMKNISMPDVLDLPIAAPGAAEQQRIAACLGSLDAALAAEAQALSALRTHKKGLMQQLFPINS